MARRARKSPNSECASSCLTAAMNRPWRQPGGAGPPTRRRATPSAISSRTTRAPGKKRRAPDLSSPLARGGGLGIFERRLRVKPALLCRGDLLLHLAQLQLQVHELARRPPIDRGIGQALLDRTAQLLQLAQVALRPIGGL